MFRSIFVISKVSLKQLTYRELLVEFGVDQTLFVETNIFVPKWVIIV